MTEIVPPEDIERLIGTPRRDYEHVGRAVAATNVIYVMHSRVCLQQRGPEGLRTCPYAIAQDQGLDQDVWIGHEDRPVYLAIHEVYGDLHPVGEVRPQVPTGQEFRGYTAPVTDVIIAKRDGGQS